MSLLDILDEVEAERKRQDAKWGEQNHPFVESDLDDRGVADYTMYADNSRRYCDDRFQAGKGTWEDILQEEYWEAFAEAAKGDMRAFREELIQVAAVAVAMIECLDRKTSA